MSPSATPAACKDLEFEYDSLYFRYEMAENYAKAQRNKRDFDKKMKILNREIKLNMQNLKVETEELNSSLLDVQSKSKNLADTMNYIKKKLAEEKEQAEKQLQRMSIDKSRAPHVNERVGIDEEKALREKIVHHRSKLDWLAPASPAPQVQKTVDVMHLVGGSNVGFKRMLNKIRSEKALPQIQPTPSPEEKQKPKSPKDVCRLIEHFLSLPKIYPVKPKKKKPEPTAVMIEKYAERAKQREMSMNYGTRQRIKRVDHHCQVLKDMFLTA